MAGVIAARLQELGIDLPQMQMPAANYVPYTIAGNLVTVSGQLPFEAGNLNYQGLLGLSVDIATGQAAARQCALNIVAVLDAATGGDLDRIKQIVRLGGFVASTPAFTEQPKVINGASDFIIEVFGERGRHARAAVGVASLPLNTPVEVEAMAELA
jgi:enamine deaminase RidA (YjgF/YER057c/UK114 family)